MKVVHIGYKYGLNNTGGAAIASTRLHKALLAAGVESHYICVWPYEKGTNVHVLPEGWRRNLYLGLTKAIRGFWKFTSYRKSIPLNIVPLFGLEKLLKQLDPDVVHVQWINADVASFEQLGRLRTMVRPSCKIIFNLHDLYDLLPEIGEGYPKSNQYIEGPDAKATTRLSRWLFARKQRMVASAHPEFIGPSKWVCKSCEESIVGRRCKTYAISNIIDPVFKYYPDKYIPGKKFVILFGCFGSRKSRMKGWPDLVAAVKLLPRNVAERSEIRIFGENGPEEKINGVPVKALGSISNPVKLLEIYHQADVFAFPSVQETQGMTKCEALCCGLPVIAFNRTACAEGIEHGHNGWIADDGNYQAFEKGIEWGYDLWVSDKLHTMRSEISIAARNAFGAETVVKEILKVYSSVQK